MTARRLCLGLAAASLLALPSTAIAAKKPAKNVDKKAPVVTKITPKSAKVGDVLVVSGRNFVPGTGKNQVFFLTRGGGTWTPAGDASATRLKVTIPAKLATLLPANGDEARIQLRIKGKRLGVNSAAAVSPLISISPPADPAGGGGGGATGCTPNPSNPASDVDQDLLTDARERELLLDPCNRDSDGDGVSDGYEYTSAIDLNSNALPYPGKRPYPNPLFKDDNVDYDGDGLTVGDEYSLWTKFGQSKLPLNYSDGKQTTVPTPAPTDPSLYYMDFNGDGNLSDDERDADGDLLGNWDESHGRMTPDWWKSVYSKDPFKETAYPITFAGTSMLDADSDGDTLPDGADDQDFDGLPNAFEIARPATWNSTYIATGPGSANYRRWDGLVPVGASARYYSRVQPFNPCKPIYSARCHMHPLIGSYADDEPWMGASNPPARGAKPGDV